MNGLLTHKNIRIPKQNKNLENPPPPPPIHPALYYIWADKEGISKVVLGFKTDITSEGLGEMFEGESADTELGIFPLVIF